MARIKKNDTVVVLSGKDKGKQGVVLVVAPKKKRVMVKGANILVKHSKARRQGESSEIKKEEGWLPLAKVMPMCGACKKPCRIQTKVLEGGKKVRVCNRCKEIV